MKMRFILCVVLGVILSISAGRTQDIDTTSVDSIPVIPPPPDTMVVAIKHTPPFVILENGLEPQGLSIKLWENISQRYLYKYRVYDDLQALMDAVSSGEADLSINPITVTSRRLEEFDFSQPFFISDTSFARRSENNFVILLKNLISWEFLGALLLLLLIIFGFGVLGWYFEHKTNEEFRGGKFGGIGQGFWWSAVTMTTVGYGDKSPRTFGGRFVAFIWMFTAVIIISSITATIASSLTVSSLESDINTVRDLKKKSVGTVSNSSSSEFLELYNVDHDIYGSVLDGLRAVNEGDIDFFVYDKPVLKYFSEEENITDLIINPDGLKTDYYSFLYPKGFKAKDELDKLIVDRLKSPEWQLELERYRANDN